LSLELSLRATTSVEKDELLQEHKNFNTEIIKRDQLISDSKSQINEKTNTVNILNERIRLLEKRLEAESNFKDETIRQLKEKINEQSSHIAQMTFQIYAANQEKMRKNQRKSSLKSPDSEKSTHESSIGKERENRISKVSGLDKLKFMPVQPMIHKFSVLQRDYKITENVLKRIPSSSTNSSESERSLNSLNQPLRALPLQALRRKGDLIPPPDPKPFLEINALSKSDLPKEALPPRKLKSLPPIRSLSDVSRLAFESPIKGLGSANTGSSVGLQSNNKPTV